MGKELVGGSLILFNHISIKLSKRALYLSKCCILYPADYLPDIFFLPILGFLPLEILFEEMVLQIKSENHPSHQGFPQSS